MSHDRFSGDLKMPAPCIVDTGIVINKQDIQRLLEDLNQVRYCYIQDAQAVSENEGFVIEVFADSSRATLVANHTLYLNVLSFDYLQLRQSADRQAIFDLVQEHGVLRLIPLTNPLQDQSARHLNAATLEAVVAEVLSASWDMQIDDEDS